MLAVMRKRTGAGQGDMLQGTARSSHPAIARARPCARAPGAHAIEQGSDDVLQVEHGSLYPALHRLEDRGLVASFWGTSENNRKAMHRLTAAGRKALVVETTRWEQLVHAVGRVLKSATE